MTKEINKSTLILREEFASNLINLINTSNVPLYVIEPVLANIVNEINKAIQDQYNRELEAYNNAVKETKEAEEVEA